DSYCRHARLITTYIRRLPSKVQQRSNISQWKVCMCPIQACGLTSKAILKKPISNKRSTVLESTEVNAIGQGFACSSPHLTL
ncbi:hypothetical protein EG68_03164, partial [Paragonimus skrjabini miyazakii]